jgi:hypothetical protein
MRLKFLPFSILFLLSLMSSGQDKVKDMKIYPYAFPLKTTKDTRYLVDQSNNPFFWSGDAAWSLIAQLSSKDAGSYLDNRMKKGFTVIMVSLIEHKFCNNAPANFYGNLPFNGDAFTNPDEKYFSHADSVIESAGKHNIVVLLAPLYLGYNCGDEGWCAEVKNTSVAAMQAWGEYVGKRYRKFPNIIWLIGGDTDPSPVKEKVEAMVKGIQKYDNIHLFSAHNQPGSMAITPWEGEEWLSVNNVYSYDSLIYKEYRNAYELPARLPYFQIESAYENEHNSTQVELRSYAYWAVLSGAMGHQFGNCPVWHFGGSTGFCNKSDWKIELDNQGSMSMDYLQRLFRSRSWHTLVPDFTHEIVVSGFGEDGTKDHVATAITSDGNTVISYIPEKHPVRINMSKVSGITSQCWWYDPATGKSKHIGILNNTGFHDFIPPHAGDMVLVIDNTTALLAAPGTVALLTPVRVRK